MACCGELLDKTEGCWLSLQPGQRYGDVIPYVLMKTDHWSQMATTPNATDYIENQMRIESDYQVGTAFQDQNRYIELHNNIQQGWKSLSNVLKKGFKSYTDELDERVNDSPPKSLHYNPTETHLEPDEVQLLVGTLKFVFEYNKMQCMEQMPTSLDSWKSYVDRHIFKVNSVHAVWTDQNRGGLPILNATGGVITRARLLPSKTLATEAAINALIAALFQVVAGSPIKANTDVIMGIAQQLAAVVVVLTYDETTYTRIFKVPSPELDPFIGYIDAYDRSVENVIAKQVAINNALRKLRSQKAIKNTDLPSNTIPQVPQPPDEADIRAAELSFYTRRAKQRALDEYNAVKEPFNFTNEKAVSGAVAAAWNALVATYKAIDAAKSISTIAKPPHQLKGAYAVAIDDAYAQYLLYVNEENAKMTEGLLRLSKNAAYYRSIGIEPDIETRNNIVAARKANIEKTIADIGAAATAVTLSKQQAIALMRQVVVDQKDIYDADQAKLKTDATKTIAAVTKDALWKQQDVSVDGLDDMVTKLLSTAVALEPIDALNSLSLDVTKRLKELQSRIHRVPIPDPKQKSDYDTSWLSIYAASENLLKALSQLLAGAASSADVTAVVDKIVAIAVEAESKLETPEQRKRRLEAEERERLRLEEIQRQKQLKIAEEDALVASRKIALRDAIDYFGAVPIVGIASGFQSIRLYIEAGRLKNQEEIRKLSIPSRIDDDDTIEPSPTDYDGLYVQDAGQDVLDAIHNTWSLLVDFMLVEGIDRFKPNEKWVLFSNSLTTYKNVVTALEKPRKVIIVPDVNNAKIVSVTTTAAEPDVGTDNLFNLKAQRWNSNSCWADAAFLTLFSMPRNAISHAIFATKQLSIPTAGFYKIRFHDGTFRELPLRYLDLTMKCKDDEVKLIHTVVTHDIAHIQRHSDECSRSIGTIKHWGAGTQCLPMLAESQTNAGDAVEALLSLIQFYRLESLVSDQLHISTSTKIVITPDPNAVMHVVALNSKEDIEYQPQLSFGGFKLYGIISLAPNPNGVGHYITHIKDFNSGRWAYFNILGNVDSGEFLPGPTDWPRPPNQINRDWNGFKPRAYVYVAQKEIDRLIALSNVVVVVNPTPIVVSPEFAEFQRRFQLSYKRFGDGTKTTLIKDGNTTNATQLHIGRLWKDDKRKSAFDAALKAATDSTLTKEEQEETVRKWISMADLAEEYFDPIVVSDEIKYAKEMREIGIARLPMPTEPEYAPLIEFMNDLQDPSSDESANGNRAYRLERIHAKSSELDLSKYK